MLLILWAYSFFMKLLWWDQWRQQIRNQVFSESLTQVLLYAIPLLFLLVLAGLFIKRINFWAVMASLALLLSFNIYIISIWTHVFERIPCACAAFIPGLTWVQQFSINLLLIMMHVRFIYLLFKERRLGENYSENMEYL